MNDGHSPNVGANIGAQLLERGCRQGALIEAPARMLWLQDSGEQDGHWIAREDAAKETQLAVVSQDCDIVAPGKTEPFVEAVAARWSADRSEIHVARKGNSVRLYLLTETEGKALLADARRRVHIKKESLLSAKFTKVLPDERTRLRFASWVAGRYDRPAIANEIVNAIHKPLVKALDALGRTGESPMDVLDRVDELRFAVRGNGPWKVDLIAMLDGEQELGAEEEAELAGWLEDILVIEDGSIEEIGVAFRAPRTISLHDYTQTTRLQLDQYSPETEQDRDDDG